MASPDASKQYFVTGGCGFIGSNLCTALVMAGHRVTILDNLSTGSRENTPAQATLIVGDVTDAETVRKAMDNADGCFHLAAVASVVKATEDWAGCHRTNLTGAIHVFDAARNGNKPVVYASSAAVYGANDDLPLSETSRTVPLSTYGADKLGCELHGAVARRIYGVPALGLRLFNVYGPGQNADSVYSGVITVFINAALAGGPVGLHGGGTQTRDFIYVDDVVRHFTRAMARLHESTPEAPVLNVCTGHSTSVRQLAEAVIAATGSHSLVHSLPCRPGDIHDSLGDPSLAQTLLGLTTLTELSEGLRATVAALEARR